MQIDEVLRKKRESEYYISNMCVNSTNLIVFFKKINIEDEQSWWNEWLKILNKFKKSVALTHFLSLLL